MKCHKVRIKLFCAISCLVIGNQELDMSKQQTFGADTVGYSYTSWNKTILSSVLRCNVFFCLLPVFQPRTQAFSRYPSDQRRLGTQRDRRIFPTSLTGDVTSEIAEDDWERGCQALRSTQNTRRHCCDGDFRLVYFRSEFRSM